MCLGILKATVWGYEQIEEVVVKSVSEKMRDVPKERIQTPPLNIAGPALMALRFVGNEKELQEMYANLLAAAMDTATAGNVLPIFADRIRLMSSDEAIIMAFFAKEPKWIYPVIDVWHMLKDGGYHVTVANYSHIGSMANCKHPSNAQVYLDSLCHLGLLEIPEKGRIKNKSEYHLLESDPVLQQTKDLIVQLGGTVDFNKKIVGMTNFGHIFCQTCIPQGNAKK